MSILKTEASKNLSNTNEIKKGFLHMVFKPIKKREKGLRRSQSGSKILSNNFQSARFDYQLDNQFTSDEESFTFGKPSSSEKS